MSQFWPGDVKNGPRQRQTLKSGELRKKHIFCNTDPFTKMSHILLSLRKCSIFYSFSFYYRKTFERFAYAFLRIYLSLFFTGMPTYDNCCPKWVIILKHNNNIEILLKYLYKNLNLFLYQFLIWTPWNSILWSKPFIKLVWVHGDQTKYNKLLILFKYLILSF